MRVLFLWGVGGALGAVGVSSAATFFTSIAVDSGLSPQLAGLLFLIAGIVAMCIRVLAGLLADRNPEKNPSAVASMMILGAIGLGVLSAHHPLSFVIGALLAVAGGWGWTGLLLGSALRLLPDDPARPGAVMQLGLFTGTAVGPLLTGMLGSALGAGSALKIGAASSLLAAVAITSGVALLRRPSTLVSAPFTAASNDPFPGPLQSRPRDFLMTLARLIKNWRLLFAGPQSIFYPPDNGATTTDDREAR